MSKIVTTEIFIENANKVHFGKYSYDKTVYVRAKEKVEITCPFHGSFFQKPNDHLSNHGCPTCGAIEGNKKIPKESRLIAGQKTKIKNQKNGNYERFGKVGKNKSLGSIEKMIQTRIGNGTYLNPEDQTLFDLYKLKVYRETKQTLKNNNDLENLHLRSHDWNLDHKFSIYDGFRQNIDPKILAHFCNLEMMPASLNKSKNKKSSIDIETLLLNIKNFESK